MLRQLPRRVLSKQARFCLFFFDLFFATFLQCYLSPPRLRYGISIDAIIFSFSNGCCQGLQVSPFGRVHSGFLQRNELLPASLCDLCNAGQTLSSRDRRPTTARLHGSKG